jgi:hypothetical protein
MLQGSYSVPPNWHEQASCGNHPDPELWWYNFYKIEDQKKLQVLRMAEAISICNQCPVRDLCLKQGLEDDNLHLGSIWGGLTAFERRSMAKKTMNLKLIQSERQITAQVRKKVGRVA